MRTYSTKKGASMPKDKLDAYGVGLLRLSEMSISAVNLSTDDIKFIGWCSINRRKVVIGKIGNFWCVYGRTLEVELKMRAQYGRIPKFKAYYIIEGKHITILYPGTNGSMADFECRNISKPLDLMSADEIFNAAKGKSSPKHGGRANSHSDIGKYKSRPGISMSTYGY